MSSVDVITDRSNIRKLLRFVDGSSSESFQIQVEIADNKTSLLTRVEKENSAVIQGFQGYGRNFEKACTKRATDVSVHYRITSFRFGGLRCVVRNETDGYIDNAPERAAVQKQTKMTDSMAQLLEALQFVDSAAVPPRTSKIGVKREGEMVDCSSILEIKTRAAGKSLDMNEIVAQVWISQTPHMVVGYYKNGSFGDLQVRDMTQEIDDWQRSNQKALCSLGTLLNRIVEVVKGSTTQVAVVKYDGGMRLEIVQGEWKKDPSKETSAPKHTSMSRAKTPIKIGNVRYEVDVAQIPRLASVVRKNGDSGSQSQEIVHEAIPHFDVALKGIEAGYRQCFRCMPINDIAQYHTLCNTYNFLQVDVCKGRTLSEIFQNLKAGQDYDDEYRDKSKARDAAFKLVYSILQDTFQTNDKHTNTIWNAVLFVVSHPGTFRWKTRNAVRAAYEKKFIVSAKQRVNLDRWHVLNDCESAQASGEDATTEEDWYDSDYSGFW